MELELEQLREMLRGRMGLLMGPAMTQSQGALLNLAKDLAKTFAVPPSENYLDVCDASIAAGRSIDSVRSAIREHLNSAIRSSALTHLSQGKWCGVLSASLDNEFETRIQTEAEKRPTRRSITVVSDLAKPIPARTIPVFKLLGQAVRDDFACSGATYRKRKNDWRFALPMFSERLAGNPLLCIGMEDCQWLLLDAFAEMLADRNSAPSYLFFLSDDPTGRNPQLRQLASGRTRVSTLPSSVSDIVAAIGTAERVGYSLPIEFDDENGSYSSVRQFHDIVAIVNDHLETSIQSTEVALLQDVLFSPSTPRWEPFVHDLDLPRSVGMEMLNEIRGYASRKDATDFACVVRGTAASGKTTLLKRVAFDLAKAGNLVLWAKPTFFPDPGRVIYKLFATIAKLKKEVRQRVFVFLDDPIGFGNVRASHFSSAAREKNVQLTLVLGVRSTDWSSQSRDDVAGSLPMEVHCELADNLTDAELAELPKYLVKLGIHKGVQEAEKECDSEARKSAADTLSMLYYLLPQTRDTIRSAIRGEYFRLGDMAGLQRVLIGATSHSTGILKSAYEMVAVSEHYRTPLPIEVLVSALNTDYGPWLEATKSDGPAWGILYSDDDEESECYRTRNSLVCELLVRTINGGLTGHSGDLNILRKLVEACKDKSSPVYREFLLRILVPYHKIKGRLEYEEGLQLYDAAIEALSCEDKTLVHHKGLWIKNVGRDATLAKKVLTSALTTKPYPYTEKGEADQHIHTSLAATSLDAVDQGQVALDDGKAEVLQHLAMARSSEFFNPRAVHVQGKLVLKLCAKMERNDTPDTFSLMNATLADIDRSLIILANPFRNAWRSLGDTHYLTDIRMQLFSSIDDIDIETEADRVWEEFSSQEGFVLNLRKRYEFAKVKNQGKHYNKAFEYYLEKKRLVEDSGNTVASSLAEVAMHVFYDWRVTRAIYSPLESEIDWETLRELAQQTLSIETTGKNAFNRYVFGLSLAHLGKWSDSTTVFWEIRQMPINQSMLWTPRGFLLGAKGGPRKVQGTMREAPGNKSYLHCEDLEADVPTDARSKWPRDGEIAHAYIRFAFAGPTAVDDIS